MDSARLFDICGRCGAPLACVADMFACVRCDLVLEWPNAEHDPKVISLAHDLMVGKIPRG